MAANGYIIVAPNRRGLPGFGQEWLEQISGDYSGQNIKDYLSAADAVILVDMDDAAQFTLAKVALEGGTVLAVGIVARQERTNRGRHGYILR